MSNPSAPSTTATSGSHPDYAELEALAVEVASAAGRSAVARAVDGVRSVGHKSTPTDLVTDIDRAIEAELVAALRARRPHDVIRGEEGGVHSSPTAEASDGAAADGQRSRAVEWVLDPIDGTVNFVLGIPLFSVSVAARDRRSCRSPVAWSTRVGARSSTRAWAAVVSSRARRDRDG